MEANTKTKIIEFNGLPGCGKSTIIKDIKKKLVEKKYIVGSWEDITKVFKENLVKNILSSISISCLIEYIKLFFMLPISKERKYFIYWNAIKISMIYKWCYNSNRFDYVLIDHGIIQHFVTLLGYDDKDINDKIKKQLQKIIIKETSIDLIVECNISIEEARNRMIYRNRDTGRLDTIKDKNKQMQAFINIENKFNIVRTLERKILSNTSLLNVDMERNFEYNVNSIINKLITRG